jgi:CHAT domain-containing protein
LVLRNLRLVPLLSLLMFGGTAAAPTPEALYRQARAVSDRGDSAKAGAVAADALQRYGDSDDPWVWRLRAIGATSRINGDDYDGARKLLQERPFPKTLQGSESDLERLEALAYAMQRLRDSPAARKYIAQAHALAKKSFPKAEARVLVMRAIVEPENRTRWASEAVSLGKRYRDNAELNARGMLGFDLANHERFDEAIAMWEPALRQARAGVNQATVQKFEGNLGWAYLELGDYENAAEYFASAYQAAKRIGSKSDQVIWTYQLGKVRQRQGDLAGAEQQFRAALKDADGHRQRPAILAVLANHELRTGRLAQAQDDINESIAALRDEKNEDEELRSMVIAGHVAAAAGRFADGERVLKEVLQRAKRTDSVATLSEAHGRLAQLYAKKGSFAEAEKQFAQSIENARKARSKVDDRELRFSYFSAVEELFEGYVDFLVARGRAEDALAITEQSRAQSLEEELPVAAKPPDVRAIARNTGATILCYWIGGVRSYLWVVTPQKVEVIRLPPRRQIESLVDAYQNSLLGARGSLTMSGARGMELWDMLAAPAAKFIAPQSRVIVVPHGRLAAFNLETLVVPKPKPHYWIEDAVFSTAGSLALLARKETKRTATPRLLLIGDAPPPSKEIVPLPRAGDEMQKVRSHFDPRQSVVLSGAKATPSAYRASSPETFTYLHFVAHGLPTRLKPLDSCVVLAKEGDTFKLYARDIARQPLNAKLVTISSCHGAGARAYAGEGLVGLGWAFLRAGADNVVAALWDVNDDVTAKLMDHFYERLSKGSDPATALRDAKLSLIAGGSSARPEFWAPFLLYGRS